MSKLRTLASGTALVWACLATGAMAQSAAGGAAADSRGSADQLTDIVVTARKVAENIQRVPVAITAYSGEELLKQNARTLPEVATLTPGMQIAPALTSAAAVNIMMRGQVQTDTLATIDPSVGVYVDGLYWARAYGLTASLVDIANFQALKGPQGTLFGRNTTGGAILINTKDPSFSDGLSGYISGTYGRFNQQSLTAVLNVPLVDDKLAVRAVYSGNKRDGYVLERNSGRMIQNLNDYTLRGKVLIKPTDDFSILFEADKFHNDTFNDSGRQAYGMPNGIAAFEAGLESLGAAGCFADQGACIGAGNAILANDAKLAQSQYVTSLSSVPHAVTDAQTYTLTATVETGIGQLKAIGGYRKIDAVLTDPDNDSGTVKVLDSSGIQKYGYRTEQYMQQWSGELTLTGKTLDTRLDYALGGFLFHEYGHDDTPASTLTAFGIVRGGGLRAITSSYGKIDTKSLGFYGQATYHATDQLSLTGGIRWSRDKRGLSSFNETALVDPASSTVVAHLCAFPVQGCPFTRSAEFSGVAYTVSLDYQINNDVLVYAKTAKGFRSGGLVLRGVGGVPASLLPFQPEKVYSYEVGLKSELFDRRLRLNLAAYYTHAKDVQRNSTVTIGTTTSTVTSNAGVVDTYGAELEATAILGAGFQVDASAAWTKPKYKSFIDFNQFDRTNEPFQLVPRWTASISPQWKGDIGKNRLVLRADFIYQSDQTGYPEGFYKDSNGVYRQASSGGSTDALGTQFTAADVAGFTAANTDKEHVLVNANATLTVLDGKLDLTVWGKNLTNLKDYVASLSLPVIGVARSVMREPRTFGATATVRF